MSERDRGLSVILHAHVPLARPGGETHDGSRFFELCEHGLLPLIEWIEGIEPGEYGPVLTLAISPCVLSMLAEPGMTSRLDAHLEERVASAHREVGRTEAAGHPGFHRLASIARERALARLEMFRATLSGDLLGALARSRRSGRLALIPSAGSHAVLPLVETPSLRALHVAAACADFREHFGERADGFWLPECCWADGLDTVLAARHIKWTVVAANGVRPVLGAPDTETLTPLLTPQGVTVFPESSQIRDALIGPGGAAEDPAFSAPSPLGHHRLRLHARGDGHVRSPFDPDVAGQRVTALAHSLLAALLRLDSAEPSTPIVVALDLEAVGPSWLEGLSVVRALLESAGEAGLPVRPPSVSAISKDRPRTEPIAATWRNDAYFSAWVDEDVAWIYRRVGRLASALRAVEPELARASLDWRQAYGQALRELICAQSSDWPAAVLAGRDSREAIERFGEHVAAGDRIVDMLVTQKVDDDFVTRRGSLRPIFAGIDTLVSQGARAGGRS